MPEKIEIVHSAFEAVEACGVEAAEGRIDPLLKGESCSAHYILTPPGMYCAEHAHHTGSIVFTVSGSWVLANRGKENGDARGVTLPFRGGRVHGLRGSFRRACPHTHP